jgi:hypothetical protein
VLLILALCLAANENAAAQVTQRRFDCLQLVQLPK